MRTKIVVKVIFIAAAVMFAQSAYAKCEGGSKTVFSCLTAKGKQIEVCDTGKTIEYSYGKPKGKPEIVVKVPRSQASTSQWQGVGRYMSYAVDIPNGNTTYNVFWGADRLSENHSIEAGVNVLINEKMAATVKCSGNNIEQNMEGIDLKPAE